MGQNFGRSRDWEPELDGSEHAALQRPGPDGYVDANLYNRRLVEAARPGGGAAALHRLLNNLQD